MAYQSNHRSSLPAAQSHQGLAIQGHISTSSGAPWGIRLPVRDNHAVVVSEITPDLQRQSTRDLVLLCPSGSGLTS